MLPDHPYELDKLRAMDADVRWKAQRINAPKLPIDDMDAHLFLDAGVLRLEPLNFGVAGGDIRSTIRMDARESPIRTRADMQVRNLHLSELLPTVELTKDAVGRIGGDIHITGTGNSIARMLGTADGEAQLGMGKGQISNLLMEFAGIDIAESLKFLVEGDKKIPIRCAFGDFAVKDGVMQTRSAGVRHDRHDHHRRRHDQPEGRDLRSAPAPAPEGSQPVLVPRAVAGRRHVHAIRRSGRT